MKLANPAGSRCLINTVMVLPTVLYPIVMVLTVVVLAAVEDLHFVIIALLQKS
jgi:hypothetical protein